MRRAQKHIYSVVNKQYLLAIQLLELRLQLRFNTTREAASASRGRASHRRFSASPIPVSTPFKAARGNTTEDGRHKQ